MMKWKKLRNQKNNIVIVPTIPDSFRHFSISPAAVAKSFSLSQLLISRKVTIIKIIKSKIKWKE